MTLTPMSSSCVTAEAPSVCFYSLFLFDLLHCSLRSGDLCTHCWFSAFSDPESKRIYSAMKVLLTFEQLYFSSVNVFVWMDSFPFIAESFLTFCDFFCFVVLSGQIDGQEITASAVLTQRVRPPPRRLSPPRRMPPPPPMWRRSPPRMRRRYVD